MQDGRRILWRRNTAERGQHRRAYMLRYQADTQGHPQDDLVPLAKEGVKGFKCFLIESGVDEFPCVNEEQVLTAMPKLVVRTVMTAASIPPR